MKPMKKKKSSYLSTMRILLAAGMALMIGLLSDPALCSQKIDPEADAILKSMSSYLGGLTSFSVKADVDNEIITTSGEKMQFSSSGSIVIKRPDRFFIKRQGMIADVELTFNGKALSFYGKRLNIYSILEGTGTIDDAFYAYEYETGLNAPGADILMADPYAILTPQVLGSSYLGIAYVNGTACHHLFFRQAEVDWQIWVQVGDSPLPLKYSITSKWVTSAPQFSIRFFDWNIQPNIPIDQFDFKVPKGAVKKETIMVNEIGELEITGEDK